MGHRGRAVGCGARAVGWAGRSLSPPWSSAPVHSVAAPLSAASPPALVRCECSALMPVHRLPPPPGPAPLPAALAGATRRSLQSPFTGHVRGSQRVSQRRLLPSPFSVHVQSSPPKHGGPPSEQFHALQRGGVKSQAGSRWPSPHSVHRRRGVIDCGGPSTGSPSAATSSAAPSRLAAASAAVGASPARRLATCGSVSESPLGRICSAGSAATNAAADPCPP